MLEFFTQLGMVLVGIVVCILCVRFFSNSEDATQIVGTPLGGSSSSQGKKPPSKWAVTRMGRWVLNQAPEKFGASIIILGLIILFLLAMAGSTIPAFSTFMKTFGVLIPWAYLIMVVMLAIDKRYVKSSILFAIVAWSILLYAFFGLMRIDLALTTHQRIVDLRKIEIPTKQMVNLIVEPNTWTLVRVPTSTVIIAVDDDIEWYVVDHPESKVIQRVGYNDPNKYGPAWKVFSECLIRPVNTGKVAHVHFQFDPSELNPQETVSK